MARQSVYEIRLMAALALSPPDYERSREELITILGRGNYLHEAAASLELQGALIEDRAAGIYRLMPGRARELLGLSRERQRELLSDSVLLPAAGDLAQLAENAAAEVMAREQVVQKVVNNAVGATHSKPCESAYITRYEITRTSYSSTEEELSRQEESRLEPRERAIQEERASARARETTAKFRHDAYVMEKLVPRRAMREELLAGRTPTARKFAVLYESDADLAREILGQSVTMNNPAAWLNTRLKAEGIRY